MYGYSDDLEGLRQLRAAGFAPGDPYNSRFSVLCEPIDPLGHYVLPNDCLLFNFHTFADGVLWFELESYFGLKADDVLDVLEDGGLPVICVTESLPDGGFDVATAF